MKKTEEQLECLEAARAMEDGQFTKWSQEKWETYMDYLSIYYRGYTFDEWLNSRPWSLA